MAWIDYKKPYDMVPKAGYYTVSKCIKYPRFIGKTMETWRVELTAEGNSLAKVKIQWGIFSGDAVSPLLFVLAMMPVNHSLWKCTAVYKLSKPQEKVNHLMYRDNI